MAAPPGAAERLRAAGLRATGPRCAVLAWLDGNAGHHPADAVVAGTGLSKATAYHVLGQLREAGLVLVAEVGPGRVLYETGEHRHHHFVCRRCGGISDVPCAAASGPCLDVAVPQAAVLEAAEVVVRGICRACAS